MESLHTSNLACTHQFLRDLKYHADHSRLGDKSRTAHDVATRPRLVSESNVVAPHVLALVKHGKLRTNQALAGSLTTDWLALLTAVGAEDLGMVPRVQEKIKQ